MDLDGSWYLFLQYMQWNVWLFFSELSLTVVDNPNPMIWSDISTSTGVRTLVPSYSIWDYNKHGVWKKYCLGKDRYSVAFSYFPMTSNVV